MIVIDRRRFRRNWSTLSENLCYMITQDLFGPCSISISYNFLMVSQSCINSVLYVMNVCSWNIHSYRKRKKCRFLRLLFYIQLFYVFSSQRFYIWKNLNFIKPFFVILSNPPSLFRHYQSVKTQTWSVNNLIIVLTKPDCKMISRVLSWINYMQLFYDIKNFIPCAIHCIMTLHNCISTIMLIVTLVRCFNFTCMKWFK